MITSVGLRLFVAYSVTGNFAEEVLAALAYGFDVATSTSIISSRSRDLGLQQAMSESSVVLIVVPPPSNRGRTNVVFECGIAVGCGVPVVLISSSQKGIPRGMQSLRKLDGSSLGALPIVLREAAERPSRFRRDHSRFDNDTSTSKVDEVPSSGKPRLIKSPARLHLLSDLPRTRFFGA